MIGHNIRLGRLHICKVPLNILKNRPSIKSHRHIILSRAISIMTVYHNPLPDDIPVHIRQSKIFIVLFRCCQQLLQYTFLCRCCQQLLQYTILCRYCQQLFQYTVLSRCSQQLLQYTLL